MSLQVSLSHNFGAFGLNATFEAPKGVIALFGRSGSGKTSIVNAIAGLLRPDAGRVMADGTVLLDTDANVDLPVHRRNVGCVFQDARLFPHLSVRQNLMFGRWFSRSSEGPTLEQVVQMLGIEHLLARQPGALSGGERQRVAIGRALLSRPRLLLMDEPLASLDEARKAEIIPYLERLRDETALPILYVSHSVSEVARLATSVVVLEDGAVVRSGSAADVLSDAGSVPLLGVRAAGALLKARVVGHDGADDLTELAVSGGRVWLPRIAAEPGSTVRVRVAAHDISLALNRPEGVSMLNVLPVTIAGLREGGGPGAAVELVSGEDRLLARVTRRAVRTLDLRPGLSCYALFKATSIARDDIGQLG